jgi:hypothetical protein
VAKTFDPCEHFEKAPTPRRLKKGFSIVLLAVEAFHQDLWTTAAGIVYVLFSILGGVTTLFQPPSFSRRELLIFSPHSPWAL